MAERKSSRSRRRSSSSRGRKYGRRASQKVERSMHEMKRGKLRSGHPDFTGRHRVGSGSDSQPEISLNR